MARKKKAYCDSEVTGLLLASLFCHTLAIML